MNSSFKSSNDLLSTPTSKLHTSSDEEMEVRERNNKRPLKSTSSRQSESEMTAKSAGKAASKDNKTEYQKPKSQTNEKKNKSREKEVTKKRQHYKFARNEQNY